MGVTSGLTRMRSMRKCPSARGMRGMGRRRRTEGDLKLESSDVPDNDPVGKSLNDGEAPVLFCVQ